MTMSLSSQYHGVIGARLPRLARAAAVARDQAHPGAEAGGELAVPLHADAGQRAATPNHVLDGLRNPWSAAILWKVLLLQRHHC